MADLFNWDWLGEWGGEQDLGFGDVWGGDEFALPEITFPDFYSPEEASWPGFGGYPNLTPDYGGLTFDTTTGRIILPGGQAFGEGEVMPAEAYTAYPQEALDRMAQGIEYQVGGPGYGDRVRAAAQKIQEGQRFAQDVRKALGVGGAAGGVGGTINEFLQTPLGRAAAAGLIGAGGLGLSSLISGDTPKLTMPSYTEAPETLALRGAAFPGQMALAGQLGARAVREAGAEAEQAPGERAFRLEALGKMGGFLPGGPEDAIVQGLRAEAIRALEPTYQDPLVEEAIRREKDRLMNQLVRQYGGLASAETSTPGTDVLMQFARESGLGRSAARRGAISAYAPAAINAQGAMQNLRRQNLGDVERLSRFGIAGVPETSTGLMTLAGSPEQARQLNLGLQQQQALTAFNQASQQRQQMASAIGGVAGKVAEAVTRSKSPFEEYLAAYPYAAGGF